MTTIKQSILDAGLSSASKLSARRAVEAVAKENEEELNIKDISRILSILGACLERQAKTKS